MKDHRNFKSEDAIFNSLNSNNLRERMPFGTELISQFISHCFAINNMDILLRKIESRVIFNDLLIFSYLISIESRIQEALLIHQRNHISVRGSQENISLIRFYKMYAIIIFIPVNLSVARPWPFVSSTYHHTLNIWLPQRLTRFLTHVEI